MGYIYKVTNTVNGRVIYRTEKTDDGVVIVEVTENVESTSPAEDSEPTGE